LVVKRIELTVGELAMVREILHRHVPDREVWAFGSRVHGPVKKFSDLDLVIVGERPLDVSVQSALTEAFDESDLPFRVDVVDWASTGEAFREVMRKDHVVLQRTDGSEP
jgi:predicted nucleotidyltransferase